MTYWRIAMGDDAAAPPTLTDLTEVDLAIIGGGFTGLTCAIYAKRMRPELKVVLLEARDLGAGASLRNEGAFTVEYQPWWRAKARGDEALARRYQAMVERAMARFTEFLDEEGIDCDLRRTHALVLASKRNVGTVTAEFKTLRSAGKDVELIESSELRRTLRVATFALGMRESNWHVIHPGKLLAGLATAARRHGVVIHERTNVERIETGARVILHTAHGRVSARDAFVAGNLQGVPLLPQLWRETFPVHHGVIVTRPLNASEIEEAALDRWPLRFDTAWEPRFNRFTSRLTDDRRLLVRGSLGYAFGNALEWRAFDASVSRFWQRYVKRFPWARDVVLEERWHGMTDGTASGGVISGLVPPTTNLWTCLGFNGHGVMQTHYNAYLLASRICG